VRTGQAQEHEVSTDGLPTSRRRPRLTQTHPRRATAAGPSGTLALATMRRLDVVPVNERASSSITGSAAHDAHRRLSSPGRARRGAGSCGHRARLGGCHRVQPRHLARLSAGRRVAPNRQRRTGAAPVGEPEVRAGARPSLNPRTSGRDCAPTRCSNHPRARARPESSRTPKTDRESRSGP
jgi:hypothetical protein